jgi:hypothetical protein
MDLAAITAVCAAKMVFVLLVMNPSVLTGLNGSPRYFRHVGGPGVIGAVQQQAGRVVSGQLLNLRGIAAHDDRICLRIGRIGGSDAGVQNCLDRLIRHGLVGKIAVDRPQAVNRLQGFIGRSGLAGRDGQQTAAK